MRAAAFFEWLNGSPWAVFLNSREWAFPAAESLHIAGLALSIGTIAIVDLRLLGLGLTGRTAAELDRDLAPLTAAGLAIMLVTGPLMFSADAVGWHANPAFELKMAALAVALGCHFTLHRRVARGGARPLIGKLAGTASLLLWSAVVAGGRMIAFV